MDGNGNGQRDVIADFFMGRSLDDFIPQEQKDHNQAINFLDKLASEMDRVETHYKQFPSVELPDKQDWQQTIREYTIAWSQHCDTFFKIEGTQHGRTPAELAFIHLCWKKMTKNPKLQYKFAELLRKPVEEDGVATAEPQQQSSKKKKKPEDKTDNIGVALLPAVYECLLHAGATLKHGNHMTPDMLKDMWIDVAALIVAGVGSKVTDKAVVKHSVGFGFDLGNPEDEWREEDQDLGSTDAPVYVDEEKEKKKRKEQRKKEKEKAKAMMEQQQAEDMDESGDGKEFSQQRQQPDGADTKEEQEEERQRKIRKEGRSRGSLRFEKMPNDAEEEKRKNDIWIELKTSDKKDGWYAKKQKDATRRGEAKQGTASARILQALSDARNEERAGQELSAQLALSNFISLATRVHFELDYEQMVMDMWPVRELKEITDMKFASTDKLYHEVSNAFGTNTPPKVYGQRMTALIYRQLTALGAKWACQRTKGDENVVRTWPELCGRDGTWTELPLTEWIKNAGKLVGEAAADRKHILHETALIVVISVLMEPYRFSDVVPDKNSAVDIAEMNTYGPFLRRVVIFRDELRAKAKDLSDPDRLIKSARRLPRIVQLKRHNKFRVHAFKPDGQGMWINVNGFAEAFVLWNLLVKRWHNCQTEAGNDLQGCVKMFT